MGGPRVAQSVEHPALGFGSSRDLTVWGSGPRSGSALRAGSLSVSLSLSAPPLLYLSLSQKQNKTKPTECGKWTSFDMTCKSVNCYSPSKGKTVCNFCSKTQQVRLKKKKHNPLGFMFFGKRWTITKPTS